MLGNDVVDLRAPETHLGAQHPRFDARVFRRAEQDAVAASPDAEAARRTRWALFAAKEAAYKLVRRLDPRTPFVPLQFAVTLEGSGRGRVRHAARALEISFEERGGGLHAVAFLPGDARGGRLAAFTAIGPADDESAAARALAQQRVAAALGIDPARLAVVREGRLPALLVDGTASGATLSLAHHGRFVAFACRWAALAGVRPGIHRGVGPDVRRGDPRPALASAGALR